jgi:phospholipid/cholesterol/gamma-HCH transport system substrate-binding protein
MPIVPPRPENPLIVDPATGLQSQPNPVVPTNPAPTNPAPTNPAAGLPGMMVPPGGGR